MVTISTWQFGLHNSKDRDNALFLNERLSDLTIIFPHQNISFPAHRLMMAKTTPYFENLFYGPMAIHDHEWKVKDNEVEPEVFKVVLAHCYEIDLLDETLEMTLQVYKLADCYLIDSLKSQCLEHLRDTISNSNYTDIIKILEWSTKYGFFDFEDKVLDIWSIKLNDELQKGCEVYDGNGEIKMNIHDFLLKLPIEKHKGFLSRFVVEYFNELIFEESWRHPKEILSCEVLMSILESSCNKDNCEKEDCCIKGDSSVKGCISPKILNQFINMKKRSFAPFTNAKRHFIHAQLSLKDESHSQGLYECIKEWKDDIEMELYIDLHIPCKKLLPGSLAIWSSTDVCLYLSYVNDQSVLWAMAMILSIKPYNIYLPRSSLSLNGFKTLVENLESAKVVINDINICSCNIEIEHAEELNTLTNSLINICKFEYELDEW